MNRTLCPCGTTLEYSKCCEPYLAGLQNAATPEILMRSRYTAYAKGNVEYLKSTLAPEVRHDFDEAESRTWAKQSEWLGLEVLSSKDNTVEFVAKYRYQGKVFEHHEVSKFRKTNERWYFVDGDSHAHEEGQGHHQHNHEPQAPVVRESPKVGRNDPCSCGSGKKFKKCCGAYTE